MRDDWEVLIMNLHPTYLKSIIKVFSAAEKNYATLSNKKLENPTSEDVNGDVDAEPMDDDPLSSSESEDEEEPSQTQASQQRRETKFRRTVIAEKTLCEITGKMIFAIHAGVDDGSMRKRLERNRLKLGPNYKELVAYMDLGQIGKNTRAKAKSKAKKKLVINGVASKSKQGPKSNAIVAEDEVEDEIDDALGESAFGGDELAQNGSEHAQSAGAEVESALGD